MAYYLHLFSPETYESFGKSSRDVSGFREREESAASKIKRGDKLLCYMTKLSRWFGVLEVQSDFFRDDTPIFFPADDPFVIRFKVNPIIWLPKEKAVPIRDPKVWNALSFTKSLDYDSAHWTAKFRNSLNQISDADGSFIEQLLREQVTGGQEYPIDPEEYEKLLIHKAHRGDKVVNVTIPKDVDRPLEAKPPAEGEIRDSIRIQANLAMIGAKMGFKIWLPRSDRNSVFAHWKADSRPVIDDLPLNYNETTIKTIEQIDVLWLKGLSIVRAFEVEHTTSIYSGILRMADLLALQPNMNIKLHIVAPHSRREKVFQELLRPVFSLLDGAPLSKRCTYLSYESVDELAKQKHLIHLSDTVLDEYAEEAE